MMDIRTGPLVRATSATSVVIWAEVSHAGVVTLTARPSDGLQKAVTSKSVSTIQVGRRYYVAPQLHGLRPATWYTYHFTIPEQGQIGGNIPRLLCFRTFDEAREEVDTLSEPATTILRLAYGSCRKEPKAPSDALNALGAWLLRRVGEREALWPHLLLLIGDQIYADDPPKELVASYPYLQTGAARFEDFAQLYEYAWTCTEGTRQALAVVPTYMIFDDHDLLNDWNISPVWLATVLRLGQEQRIVDGLVAYWLYQGWGNLSSQSRSGEQTDHALVQIMDEAAASGTDALPALRACIQSAVRGQNELRWHYEIPTIPPIFVANARANRSMTLSEQPNEIYAPGRIMSSRQITELRTWLAAQERPLALFVSSVPVLLPPLIGLAEYLMGLRLWYKRLAPLRWLGQQLARLQLKLAVRTSFDHWPVYTETWHEFLDLLKERRGDLLILSGDVHFSYALEGHQANERLHPDRQRKRLYQFVSTPLQNSLEAKHRRLIEGQARLPQIRYGRLHTRMLSLKPARSTVQTTRNLLFEDTLASLHVRLDEAGRYTLQHEYLGVVDGELELLGSTELADHG